jgi:CheY-like chemotaxis protein
VEAGSQLMDRVDMLCDLRFVGRQLCCEQLAAAGGLMGKPAILAVDDDPAVSAAIVRDLRRRYAIDYRVLRATSGPEALDVLSMLALRDQPVALIIADQRMPRMTGIEMLAQART